MAEAVSHEKRYVTPPGFTQIPNVLFDEILPVAGHAEWKVTCAIARQTFGWGIETRRFTNAQLCELTGLSRQSVTNGLEEAEKRGFIGRRHLGGNHFEFGLRVKKLDAPPDSEGGELPTYEAESILPTRKLTSKGNKTLRGKQKQPAAPPQGDVRKSDAGKKGARFVPNPDEPADAVIVELFELWLANTTQPERTVLTNHRASQCRARMREQAEGVDRDEALTVARAQMVEALEGWFASSWHRANQAFDWETLFRSRKKVEMFRQRHHAEGASAGKSSAERAEYATTKPNPELEAQPA